MCYSRNSPLTHFTWILSVCILFWTTKSDAAINTTVTANFEKNIQQLISLLPQLVESLKSLNQSDNVTNEQIVLKRLQQIDDIKQKHACLFKSLPECSHSQPIDSTTNNTFAYDDEFARIKFLPMAAAAYGEDVAIGQCLTRTYSNAKLFRNIVVPCQNVEGQRCSGFTAVSESEKAIIISFSGTNTLGQLIVELTEEFTYQMIPMPNNSGNVGAYFYDIFTQLWVDKQMILDVASLIHQYPSYKIWVTGHSLGGSLAVLGALHILSDIIPGQSERIFLLTIGEQRTGDKQLAQFIDQTLSFFNYRVVHANDFFTHIAPRNPLIVPSDREVQHHMTEVWYPGSMDPEETPFYWICNGDEDPTCSDSVLGNSIEDHMDYYGLCIPGFGMAGCEPSGDNKSPMLGQQCLKFWKRFFGQ